MNPGQNQHWWTCCSGARTCAVQDTAKARSAQAGHAAHTLAPTHWHPHSHAHTVHTQGKTQPMLWRAHTHTHTQSPHTGTHTVTRTQSTHREKSTAQALAHKHTHTQSPHTGTHTVTRTQPKHQEKTQPRLWYAHTHTAHTLAPTLSKHVICVPSAACHQTLWPRCT